MLGDDPTSGGLGLNSSTIQSGIGGAGLGMGALGLVGNLIEGSKASDLASQEAGLSMQNAGYEENISNLRRQQMNLFGQRQQMENFRNVQKARAQGMAAAVSSGSQFGSGVAGAQSSESATGGRNQMQLGQDLSIGNQIFDWTGKIDQNKIQMAQLQSQQASAQGMQSGFQGLLQLGMGAMQSAGPIGMMAGV